MSDTNNGAHGQAVNKALKMAYAATARGNVYSQLGLVVTPLDLAEMKARAAELDLKKEIKELKAALGK